MKLLSSLPDEEDDERWDDEHNEEDDDAKSLLLVRSHQLALHDGTGRQNVDYFEGIDLCIFLWIKVNRSKISLYYWDQVEETSWTGPKQSRQDNSHYPKAKVSQHLS